MTSKCLDNETRRVVRRITFFKFDFFPDAAQKILFHIPGVAELGEVSMEKLLVKFEFFFIAGVDHPFVVQILAPLHFQII